MKFNVLVVLLTLLSLSNFAQKMDTTIVLDEFELEYLRMSEDSLTNLFSTGTSYTIDYQTIQAENSPTINEVLRKVPGMHIKNYGGIGGIKTVSVRGLGGQHTGILLNNNLLVDQKSGQVDLASISTLGISAIHFNIGSVTDNTSSAKTYAYNNSINFEENPLVFLKDQKRKIITGLGVGSFSTFNPYVNYFTKTADSSALGVIYEGVSSKGNYSYEVGEEGDKQTNKREHSQYRRHLIKANWIVDNSRYKIQVNGVFRNSNQELPGAVILYNPNRGQETEVTQGLVQFSYLNKIGKYKQIYRGCLTHDYTTYNDEYFSNSTGGIKNSYKQSNAFVSAGLTRKIKSFDFFLITDLEYGTLTTNVIEGIPNRLSNYAVLGTKFTKGRVVIDGNLLSTLVRDKNDEDHITRQKITGFAGVNYQLVKGKDVYVKTSYKSSYRLPTFSDLYYNNIGNKDLVPETSRQFNLGITGVFRSKWAKQIYYSVNGYYGDIDEKIIAVPTQNLFVWSMQNIGKVTNYGTELSFLYKSKPIFKQGRLDINYAYTLQFVKDRSDETATTYNEQIIYTPQEIVNLRVTPHLNSRLSFYWNLQFIGHQFYLPENIYDNLIDAVTLHEIGLNYKVKLKKKVEIIYQISVRNLTNEQYHLVRSFPMQGRNLWTSLIFTI